MRIEGIDHFQIAAPNELIEAVRDFYVQVLRLADGPRPQFSSGGYWLYAGGRALVHLRAEEGPAVVRADAASSYCDHIALSCEGLAQFEEHLTACDVAFTKNHIADLNLHQLFFRDPAGVGIELAFQMENQ